MAIANSYELESARTQSEHLREQVQRLMLAPQQTPPASEKRTDVRIPYPYPVYLQPSDKNGLVQQEKTTIVLGRHLAERGLDFFHKDPLPHRHMIASFQFDHGNWISFVMALNWCRFNRYGWYDTGGRFLMVADLEMAEFFPEQNSHPPMAPLATGSVLTPSANQRRISLR